MPKKSTKAKISFAEAGRRGGISRSKAKVAAAVANLDRALGPGWKPSAEILARREALAGKVFTVAVAIDWFKGKWVLIEPCPFCGMRHGHDAGGDAPDGRKGLGVQTTKCDTPGRWPSYVLTWDGKARFDGRSSKRG